MKEKLNCVMLIDDDRATNFLHEIVLEKADCAKTIKSLQSAEEALVYLKTKVNGKNPQPELIFLDINMPRMNGWEFLDEYHKLEDYEKGGVVVVMLTTSLNPSDSEKAKEIVDVKQFLNKPLTIESVNHILQTFFPNHL